MTKIGFLLNNTQDQGSIPIEDSQKSPNENLRYKKISKKNKHNREILDYFTPPFYTPQCTDKETLELINKLKPKSKDYIYHIMYLGDLAAGNRTFTPFTGNEWVTPEEPQGRQERQHEPKLQVPKQLSYQEQLGNDGYRIVKMCETGNNFHAAVIKGLSQMNPTHPRCPKDVDELKNIILETVNSQEEEYKDIILAVITGDIWEMIKQTESDDLDELMSHLPQGFFYPLTNFYNSYWRSEYEERELITDALVRWAVEEGINIYIDAMKDGFVFEGSIECGIISRLIDLPITIHKVGRHGIGSPILIGDVEIPPAKRMHLYHYRHRFDLMICIKS